MEEQLFSVLYFPQSTKEKNQKKDEKTFIQNEEHLKRFIDFEIERNHSSSSSSSSSSSFASPSSEESMKWKEYMNNFLKKNYSLSSSIAKKAHRTTSLPSRFLHFNSQNHLSVDDGKHRSTQQNDSSSSSTSSSQRDHMLTVNQFHRIDPNQLRKRYHDTAATAADDGGDDEAPHLGIKSVTRESNSEFNNQRLNDDTNHQSPILMMADKSFSTSRSQSFTYPHRHRIFPAIQLTSDHHSISFPINNGDPHSTSQSTSHSAPHSSSNSSSHSSSHPFPDFPSLHSNHQPNHRPNSSSSSSSSSETKDEIQIIYSAHNHNPNQHRPNNNIDDHHHQITDIKRDIDDNDDVREKNKMKMKYLLN